MRELTGTKRRIVEAAIVMFSEQSFERVTTRDIAKAVSLQPASLYSHFSSKEELLSQIYKIYMRNLQATLPNIDELLDLATTENPMTVLARTNYFFDPSIQETMDRIISIAAGESKTDKQSKEFIQEVLFDIPSSLATQVLQRLLDLERIKPLDIEGFLVLLTNFCYSAAIRNFTEYAITLDEWTKGITLLFGLVEPTGK
jgi:AcrR family transcriptional regulator